MGQIWCPCLFIWALSCLTVISCCSIHFKECEIIGRMPVKIGKGCLARARNRTLEQAECFRLKLIQLDQARDCACSEAELHRAIVDSNPTQIKLLALARCTVNSGRFKPPSKKCKARSCMLAARKLRIFLARKRKNPRASCGVRARKTKELLSRCMSLLENGKKDLSKCGNTPFYMLRYGRLYVAYVDVLCSGCDIAKVTKPCSNITGQLSPQPCNAVRQFRARRSCGLKELKKSKECGVSAENFVVMTWDLAEESLGTACGAYIYAENMRHQWGCYTTEHTNASHTSPATANLSTTAYLTTAYPEQSINTTGMI